MPGTPQRQLRKVFHLTSERSEDSRDQMPDREIPRFARNVDALVYPQAESSHHNNSNSLCLAGHCGASNGYVESGTPELSAASQSPARSSSGVRARIPISVSIIQAFLFLVHIAMYATWTFFWGAPDISHAVELRIALAILVRQLRRGVPFWRTNISIRWSAPFTPSPRFGSAL